VDTLDRLKMEFPQVDQARRKELESLRKQLEK